jgi:hypothetical protein
MVGISFILFQLRFSSSTLIKFKNDLFAMLDMEQFDKFRNFKLCPGLKALSCDRVVLTFIDLFYDCNVNNDIHF